MQHVARTFGGRRETRMRDADVARFLEFIDRTVRAGRPEEANYLLNFALAEHVGENVCALFARCFGVGGCWCRKHWRNSPTVCRVCAARGHQ